MLWYHCSQSLPCFFMRECICPQDLRSSLRVQGWTSVVWSELMSANLVMNAWNKDIHMFFCLQKFLHTLVFKVIVWSDVLIIYLRMHKIRIDDTFQLKAYVVDVSKLASAVDWFTSRKEACKMQFNLQRASDIHSFKIMHDWDCLLDNLLLLKDGHRYHWPCILVVTIGITTTAHQEKLEWLSSYSAVWQGDGWCGHSMMILIVSFWSVSWPAFLHLFWAWHWTESLSSIAILHFTSPLPVGLDQHLTTKLSSILSIDHGRLQPAQ